MENRTQTDSDRNSVNIESDQTKRKHLSFVIPGLLLDIIRKYKQSIRWKIIFYTVVPIFITYLLILHITISTLRDNSGAYVETQLLNLVLKNAELLDTKFKHSSRVAHLTKSILEDNPDITEDMIYDLIRGNVETNPTIYGSAIAYAPYRFEPDRRLFSPYAYMRDNRIVTTDIGGPEYSGGYDYTKGDWEWWTKPRDNNSGFWLVPDLEEFAGEVLIVTYTVPFYSKGNFLGVTTVDVSLNTFINSLTGLGDNLIMTKGGRFVLHPAPERILNKTFFDMIKEHGGDDMFEFAEMAISDKSGVMQLPQWGGRSDVWGVFASIPSTDWIYISLIPIDETLVFVIDQWRILAIMLFVTLLMTVVVIWFASGTVTRPVKELKDAALILSEGNYDVKIAHGSKDELGQLARVFNEMSAIVSSKKEDLEKEIVERTRELEQSRLEIEKQKKLFKKTLDNMDEGIVMFDKDFNIQVCNKKYAELLDVPQQLIERARTYDELIRYISKETMKDPERVDEALERMRSNRPFTINLELPNQKILEVHHIPMTGGGAIRTYADVSEREKVRQEIAKRMQELADGRKATLNIMKDAEDAHRKIKESQQLLEAVVEHNAARIFVKDIKGRYVLVNKSFEKSTGQNREDILGKTTYEILPNDSAKLVAKNDQEIMKKQLLIQEEQTVSVDNIKKTFLSMKFPIYDFDGKVNGLCGLATDITEQKKLQTELAEAKEKAETATTAKSSFLASMSHELRTPLNGIIGMVDLLRHSKLNSEHQQILKTIYDSGQSLLAIINDILDFSKIEAGKLDLEDIPFSVLESVENSVTSLFPFAQYKNLNLITYVDPTIPDYVIGDPIRVGQIMVNLVNNAIKFTEQGDIVIRADRIENIKEQGTTIRFSVIDNGIGISPDVQKKLFSAFTQGDTSTTRQYGGTGLGLSICQRLTELMDGEIGVNSEPRRGSKFFTRIHFDEYTKEFEEQGKVRDLQGLSIMVVSNNEMERFVCSKYLQHWNAKVECIAELDYCLDYAKRAQAREESIDIIVLGFVWEPKQQQAVYDAFKKSRLTTNIRFVMCRKGRRLGTRVEVPEIVTLDVDPMQRVTFLSAVAIAAGRASPEVQHKKEIEDLSSGRKTLSIDEAMEQNVLILVAEDSPTNQDVINRQLQLLGYTCELANNGKQALDAWHAKNYAMLLTDCHMPLMDGFELTRMIREEEKSTATHKPIIAITANALEGEEKRCLAAGMDDYLSKPINMKELKNKLEQWMPQATPVKAKKVRKKRKKRKAEKIKTTAVDNSQPIDDRALKDVFGDDQDTFKEILDDFIIASKEMIGEIKAGWNNRSAEAVKQAAHKLKSSARSVGANSLADLCFVLETAGREEDWSTIDGEISKLALLMTEVETYIQSL